MEIEYLHTMIRVQDLDAALEFFVDTMGFIQTSRQDNEGGRFSLIFLAAGPGQSTIELTHNWDNTESYGGGRNFGHLAYRVENIHEYCAMLMKKSVPILRPPRDGHMAFIRSPDGISIELLQKGPALEPIEPWISMPNQGEW